MNKHTDSKFIIGDMFVDARDNKRYKKVKIGNQIWMAEDLKAATYADGEGLTLLPDNTSLYDFINLYDKGYFKRDVYANFSGSVVYPINDEGYYYTWAAVMNGSLSANDSPSNVQGICPDGWHVPSSAEFNELLDFLKADYIKDKEGQALRSDYASLNDMDKGTNYYGFNALAKGYHYSDFYGQTGEVANYWTTLQTDYESWGHYTQAYFFNIGWNYANIWPASKVEGRCVRCLQNQ
ncbi:MAG: FISUMP domain-containing protein [Bacteroidales bacterium]|nr:FISUMP domain-containing protein [Bacteroidales bacterium]